MTVLLVALCVLIDAGSQAFRGSENLQNLTRHIAFLAIFAIGEGIVILSGGIDLSVGSIIAFAGVLLCYTVVDLGWSPLMAVIAVIAFGAAIGLWHGFLVSRIKLQPFIATLCTMLALRGHGRVLANEETMGFANKFLPLRSLGDGFILGIPTPVVILAGVVIIAAFFLHFTVFGRYLYAIGRNPQAAEYSGIKVGRMQTVAYIACGALAALAGILYATYTNSVQPSAMGQAQELYAIAAAVLGGCSMRGGEGTVVGVIVGAAIMRLMYNGINLLGIAPAWEYVVIGYVILIGVIADSVYKQIGARVDRNRDAVADGSDPKAMMRRVITRRVLSIAALVLLIISLFMPLVTSAESDSNWNLNVGSPISYVKLLSMLHSPSAIPIPLYLPILVAIGFAVASISKGFRAVRLLAISGAIGVFTVIYLLIGIQKGYTFNLIGPERMSSGFYLYGLACLIALITGVLMLAPIRLPSAKFFRNSEVSKEPELAGKA
jgi:ribose transport system permease protein